MTSGNKEYLGDGVYASFDGWQIWLSTLRENGEHRIALEPYVFHALCRYAKALHIEPAQGES